MGLFDKAADLLNKPIDVALNTVAKPMINKAVAGYGEVRTLKVEDKKLKATLVLAGLEDREIEVTCSDVYIAEDGSAIRLRNYSSNMPFAEKALNDFATDEYEVDNQPARAALMLLRKAF